MAATNSAKAERELSPALVLPYLLPMQGELAYKMKQPDPYYLSKAWRDLRTRRLSIDHHKCVVRGCAEPATVVDHIRRRKDGGPDTIENLRSLCDLHDRQVKELPTGRRRNNGNFKVIGCDGEGWPCATTV